MEMFFVAVCVHYYVKSENDCESTVRVRGSEEDDDDGNDNGHI